MNIEAKSFGGLDDTEQIKYLTQRNIAMFEAKTMYHTPKIGMFQN